MSDAYIGELRPWAGNFAPINWMLCNGQLLPIQDNEALYTLIGTTYGGDGVTNFALPNLQSRIPFGQGQGPGLSPHTVGEMAGNEQETLGVNQMPIHNHVALASSAVGHLSQPAAASPAVHRDFSAFSSVADTTMSAQSVASSGGSQPHDNLPPTLAVTYIICVAGIFPQRN